MLQSFQDPRRRHLLIMGFAAFFLLGAQQAMYGPSLPLFRAKFGLEVDQVSAVVSAQFLGAFLAIVASGVLIKRFGYRRVLVVGAIGVAVGLVSIALAPVWWRVVAGAFVAGLGFGLINLSFNLLLALSFRPNAAPALNLLNAVFGVGAMVGPLLVALFEPRMAVPFLVMAGVAALLLLLVLVLDVPKAVAVARNAAPASLGLLALFVLVYFFYVATEAGVANFQTEHLTPHFGAATAAGFPALFWGAITVGRLLAAPLSAHVRPPAMVLGSTTLATLTLLFAGNVLAAPYLYAAVGLFLAPVFGTALAWLTEVFPERAEQYTPIVVAAANLGPVLTAPLIGLAVTHYGGGAIPMTLAGLGALLVASVAVLFQRTRGRV
ncbi:MAG: MFS transporter [Trueperaceae bacterium]|jgi:fucose permease